jgi:hypothetical protein
MARREIPREYADPELFRQRLREKVEQYEREWEEFLERMGPLILAAGGKPRLRRHMSTRQLLGYMSQLLKRIAKGGQKAGSLVWDAIKSGAGWLVAGLQTWGLLKFGQMELKQSEALTKYGEMQLQVQNMINQSMEEKRKLEIQKLALDQQRLMLEWQKLLQQQQRAGRYWEGRRQSYRAAKQVDPAVKAALEAQVAEAKARSAAVWQDWERARQHAREMALEAYKAQLKAALKQGEILGEDWLDANKKAREAALATWKANLQAFLENLEAANKIAVAMRKAEAEMRKEIAIEEAKMRRELTVERLKGLIEMDLEREKTLRNLQETARLLNVEQRRLVGDLLKTVQELIKQGKDYKEPLRQAIDILTNPEKYAVRLQVREVRVRRW